MRVSEHYGIGRAQSDLEFVDVDIRGDTRLFIDPRSLRSLDSAWGNECVSLLQSFFGTVLEAIRSGDDRRAQRLIASLSEPNQSHLGLSRGRSQGSGLGAGLAVDVFDALRTSRAVTTGLLADLEDSILFVPGIGHDRISDIATNIIRRQLIEFTTDVCNYYGIPLTNGVSSGRLWNRRTEQWDSHLLPRPMTPEGPLLLVPKSIVRTVPTFDPGQYYRFFVQPFLQDLELQTPGSSLVEVLKSGRRKVTKKSIAEEYGFGKETNLKVTIDHPEILDNYREAKSGRQQPPGHNEIAIATDTPPPDWDALLEAVLVVEPGTAGADQYHRAIERLFTALFYPALDMPKREFKRHDGRKRIDIDYTNTATRGFFAWVRDQHGAPASYVPVECKNYSNEIGNHETDQLSGRFATHRGQVGIICHRGYSDKDRVLARCRDTALDGRGYMLALDDDDLRVLVEEKRNNPDGTRFQLLFDRFRGLLA